MRTNNSFVKEYLVKDMHNTNEARVYEIMEEIMEWTEYSEICFCSICLGDIYAITLNSLPAHYKHSLTVDMHKEHIQDKEIKIEIVKAIERVRKKPNHP